MKKPILLMLITMLSTNVVFLIDEAPTTIKEPIKTQIKEEKSLVKIQPTGIWFTEEEIIDE